MATFRVTRLVPVTTMVEEVLIETDDWLEAEDVSRQNWNQQAIPKIEGTHPTHKWELVAGDESPRCKKCRSLDNGSYGSHAPCGTKFSVSLREMIQEWRAGR